MVALKFLRLFPGPQRNQFMAHRPEHIGTDHIPGGLGIDAGQAVIPGDAERGDVGAAMARGIFVHIQQIFEQVLGTVEVMGMAVLLILIIMRYNVHMHELNTLNYRHPSPSYATLP